MTVFRLTQSTAFIIVFKRASHGNLPSGSSRCHSIEFLDPVQHYLSIDPWISPNFSLPYRLATQILCTFPVSPCAMHDPLTLVHSLITLVTFGERYAILNFLCIILSRLKLYLFSSVQIKSFYIFFKNN
jgi:hypothetical protein